MSFTTTYKSSCGCVFDIDVASNWENGGIEIDDVCIVSICDKHRPTPLALDGGDSVARQAESTPEVLSPSPSDSASRPAASKA